MAPRKRVKNDISKSKLLAGFKLQEARKIADTDICKKNDEELISLSDKVATLQPVKILNYLLADKKLLALAMCYGPDENRKNKRMTLSCLVLHPCT